ncbi:MAG TPA: YtxH domain-containing protein [Nitrospiraceae bacterium]|jgi:gas vesicle protein
MSEQGKQVAKVAALVAGGAVIGAGLGLLFAPSSGVETRRGISRYAKRTQIQATRWSRAIQSGVKEAMERGRAAYIEHRDTRPTVAA